MPTPKEWQENLAKIQEITRSVTEVTQVMRKQADTDIEKAVASVPPEQRTKVREIIANPDDASLALMADDILRTIGFIDSFEGKQVFLRGYLKGLITTTVKAYELAGEDGIETDDNQNPDV